MIPPSSNADRSTGFYAPELDGLRCLAVTAVMIAHFSWTWRNYFDFGAPGVRLFFVLSGFLITHLLLLARARHDAGRQTRGSVLRQFYLRRIFRLWPLYFGSLAVAYAFHVDGTDTPFAWHGLFATNYYVFQYQTWPALLSHYWTLAVEQQFYVVWPLAVLWLPARGSVALLPVLLVLGPLTRWFASIGAPPGSNYSGVLLPSCLDFFALGSAIAWAWRHHLLARIGTRTQLQLVIGAMVGWLLLGAVHRTAGSYPVLWIAYDPLLQAIGFTALIVFVLRFPDSRLAAFFRWRPLVFLGQISYGIYILHNFAHRAGPPILRRITGQSYHVSEVANIVYYIAISVLAAIFSYYLFEDPIRRLGRRITSSSTRSRGGNTAPASQVA